VEEPASLLFDFVPAGIQFNALLVFTPKGGSSGETAQFNVIIDAAQLTNAGEQLVGSSNDIQAEINIIDLAQCIKYTPDAEAGVILQENEEEDRLDIDISDCGNATIDFWLCKDDKGCSGGVEGEILVKPDKFTLNANTQTKTILVGRQPIPGLYGIDVQVRTPGSNYHSVGLVDVLVKPEPEDAFELSKYEFTTIGIGSIDSAELTNRYLSQAITVDASICDWGDAAEEEDEWFDWPKAGIGAALGALQGMKPAMEASRAAAGQEAVMSSDALKSAKKSAEDAQATDEATQGEHKAVCNTLAANSNAAASATSACAETAGASTTAAAQSKITQAKAECDAFNKDMEEVVVRDGQAYNTTATGANATTGEHGLETVIDDSDFSGEIFSNVTTKMQAIASQLEAATAEYERASGLASAQCSPIQSQACSCVSAIQSALAATSSSIADVEAYSEQALEDSSEALSGVQDSVGNARDSIDDSFDKMKPLTNASSGGGKFAGVMATNSLAGLLLGGLSGNLFGEGDNVCDQHRSMDLPDYVINVLVDLLSIDSENPYFDFDLDRQSAQVIGEYDLQKAGITITNNGEENPKPVYSTVTFNAIQHLHNNPTEIERGKSNFGPFNVPDRTIQRVGQKIHLKFKTQEPVETLPVLTFDTLSCISGNKIGRTGSGALPRVKLDWSFGAEGITKDSCLEENPDGIYCDATQFSLMLSQKLNALKEFFDANPTLYCPENPLASTLDEMSLELEVSSADFVPEECYIPTTSGMLESRPAIMQYIDSMDINPTQEISDSTEFEKTIHFNALMMKDAFSNDFQTDFVRHYSEERFFDTPDWFYGLGLDDSGNSYGIAKLFEEGRVKFTNRFFDSEALSSAGMYDVIISIESDNDSYRFFNSNGEPSVWITIDFQLLQDPNPNSAFYSMPINGSIGLEGDSFNRNGYGVTFDNQNTGEKITINNDAQPTQTFSDAGSNPLVFVDSSLEKSFYSLNTSASERGNLLQVERLSAIKSRLKFSPSKATPVLLKVSANEIMEDDLSVFYVITSSTTPVDAGSSITYWEGAGACLDPTGVIITERFDQTPDRAAVSSDPVLNWQAAYAVDFGEVMYTGDTYVRTIIYTNPLRESTIKAEHPKDNMEFLTADEQGLEVQLNGVSGVPFNNSSGGSSGNVTSLEDVFDLVEEEMVCVIDSGRKASFFWNPKSIYEARGTQRSISEVTNSLEAGRTCIG